MIDLVYINHHCLGLLPKALLRSCVNYCIGPVVTVIHQRSRKPPESKHLFIEISVRNNHSIYLYLTFPCRVVPPTLTSVVPETC